MSNMKADLRIPKEIREAAQSLTEKYSLLIQHQDADAREAINQEVQWAKGKKGLYTPAKSLAEALAYAVESEKAGNVIELPEDTGGFAVVAPIDTFLLAGARCVVPSRFVVQAYEAVTRGSFRTEDDVDEIEEV